MKNYIRINNSFIILFIILTCFKLTGCEKKCVRKDKFKTISGNSKTWSMEFEVTYHDDSITLCRKSIYGNEKSSSCGTLIKMKNGYYSKNTMPERLGDFPKYELILSTDNDTSYSFKDVINVNSREIKKISNSKYQSLSTIKGKSDIKRIFIFDKDYKILKAEYYFKGKKFVFVR